MLRFNAYFREKVIRKYIEICDLHPVHGSYFREYSLDMRQFYLKCLEDGYDWYRWEEVRNQCMSLEDMISSLEDAGYKFKVSEDNIIDFEKSPKFQLVKSSEPIIKISKNNIKNESYLHPVLNGMLYDRDLKKRNALRAIELIKKGVTVKEAIKTCQSSFNSICQNGYQRTGRQDGRVFKKVNDCIDLMSTGVKLNEALKQLKLGAWSFYRYRNFFL